MSITSERENSELRKESESKPKNWWRIALLLAVAIALGAWAVNRLQQAQNQSQAQTPPQSKPVATYISALGRLEPPGEVIALSAPSSVLESRLERLLIKEGKRVRVGDVVAILDSRDRAQAALEKAKADIQVTRANLARVQAGAKQGEIEAQKATIARLEAELQGERQTLQATIARIEA